MQSAKWYSDFYEVITKFLNSGAPYISALPSAHSEDPGAPEPEVVLDIANIDTLSYEMHCIRVDVRLIALEMQSWH